MKTEIVRDDKSELEQELEEIQSQIDALKAGLEEKPDYGLGQGDPTITRWEFDQAMLERLEERAESLKRALGRLDEGTYGVCERCGNAIHPDRLEILPDTKICIQCAQSGEQA
jgi:DnaK suppressor protein